MTKLSAFTFFWLVSFLARAQQEESTRSLAATYYAQPVEQAVVSLMAKNLVWPGQQVEYRAGKSVLLTAGFEAQAGSVFAAHTDYHGINIGDAQADHILVKTYPNPFVDKTTIIYQLASTTYTTLLISDVEGKEVGRLVDNKLQVAGRYEVEWRAEQFPAGSYICTLEAGNQHLSSRIIRK